MLDLNTIFHDNISVKPKEARNKVLLIEPQNEDKTPTRQYIRFPSNIKEYCVLKPEKMSKTWFEKTVNMCDYLVLYKMSGSISAVVIEMKSSLSNSKDKSKQIQIQLKNGEKLLNCLCCFLDSCDIQNVEHLLLYKNPGMQKKGTIKKIMPNYIKVMQYTPNKNDSIDITKILR